MALKHDVDHQQGKFAQNLNSTPVSLLPILKDASVDVVTVADFPRFNNTYESVVIYNTCMYIFPPTFLQLHVESAAIALLVGAVGRVGADPALQVGGGGRRGPGHQVVGQGGVVPTGLRRAPRDGRVASAEPRRDVFICIYLCTRKKTQPKKN